MPGRTIYSKCVIGVLRKIREEKGHWGVKAEAMQRPAEPGFRFVKGYPPVKHTSTYLLPNSCQASSPNGSPTTLLTNPYPFPYQVLKAVAQEEEQLVWGSWTYVNFNWL